MRTRPDRWLLLVGVAAVATYLLFVHPGTFQLFFYDGIGLVSIIAMLVGIRRNAPSAAKPWMLTAGGLGLFVAGDFSYTYYTIVLHQPAPGASIVDVFYLGGYLFLALGCAAFMRSIGGKDRDAFLDAGITAVGGAIIMWALVQAAGIPSTGPVIGRIVLGAYPVCDVVLLAMLVRLALVPAVRSGALWFVITGFTLLLMGDLVYALLAQGDYQAAGLLDATWLLSYLAFGVASLHPRMGRMIEPKISGEPQPLGWRRILLIGTALLVGPIVTLVRDWGSAGGGSAPIAVASAVIAALVLWRITRATRDRQRAEIQLRFMALHDELTRLPNRALLRDRLEVALARARRTEGIVAVIFLDLDGFKHVNDGLGHDVGDQLLGQAAGRLSAAVRPADTVARFGGDEFVILAEDVGSYEDARSLADRLRISLAGPFHLAGQEVFVSASVGIALADEPDMSAEVLIKHADAAMYRAKDAGRDRIEFFDGQMQEAVTTHLALSGDLHTALGRGELLLQYQPIVDLQTERLVGTEALIRWQHPQRGLVPPDRFIPIAESSGLIVPIGRWVMETAFDQLVSWHRSEAHFGEMEIAVNVSAVQLLRRDFARDVAEALSSAGLDPRFVVLEITEGVLLADRLAALQAVRELKEVGVRIALDDFGTGYSSLSYLLQFPVDILKIDMSFVRGLGIDAEATAIVGSVVALGRTLGLTVVAEGVETEDQFQHLKRMGCSLAQGYHISRPAPPGALEENMRTWAEERTARLAVDDIVLTDAAGSRR
jgi:diguanylate cyclase (GGDEF)-like protein